jgi:hypothetical protein
MKKSSLELLVIIVCCFALLLFGCGNGKPKTTQINNNKLTEINKTDTKTSKSIPKDFVPIRVLNQVIYVPKEFKKMEIPAHLSNAGMALIGNVRKKVDNPKDALIEHYDVSVFYEKSPDLRKIKPHEEEQALELIFNNAWNASKKAAKVATKKEIISKTICNNIDGHKYLKAISVVGNPNKPNNDMLNREAIYIFDDTVYFISTSELVQANSKYAAEIDSILDTFGSIRVQEVRQTAAKEVVLPQKVSIETEAIDFFKKYHEAITNKEFEYAFNCLSPNLQRDLGGFDKYFEGFITTVSSRVQSAEVLSLQENTVVIKYILKAEDFGESKNADIVEQRFSGKAVLRKNGGVWKIIDNRAKRL